MGWLTRREALALGCAMNAPARPRSSSPPSACRWVCSRRISYPDRHHGDDHDHDHAADAALDIEPRAAVVRGERSSGEGGLESRDLSPGSSGSWSPVDDSVTGTFAARLAGLIAGTRGMPVTMLQEDLEFSTRRAEQVSKGAAAADGPLPAARQSRGRRRRCHDAITKSALGRGRRARGESGLRPPHDGRDPVRGAAADSTMRSRASRPLSKAQSQ